MSGDSYERQRANRSRSAGDFYRARKRSKALPAPASFEELTLERVIDPEHLIQVFYDLRSHGGQAPGPDGLTYRDFGPSEVGKYCACSRRSSAGGAIDPARAENY